ncbi:MAG: hypothetical protein GJ680_07585 [Alteromonadaceae bacterium]|nr:hypothetical protein [Alteromonadaceae bacterium]
MAATTSKEFDNDFSIEQERRTQLLAKLEGSLSQFDITQLEEICSFLKQVELSLFVQEAIVKKAKQSSDTLVVSKTRVEMLANKLGKADKRTTEGKEKQEESKALFNALSTISNHYDNVQAFR